MTVLDSKFLKFFHIVWQSFLSESDIKGPDKFRSFPNLQGRRSKANRQQFVLEKNKSQLFLSSVSSVIYQVKNIVLDLRAWTISVKCSLQAKKENICLPGKRGRLLTTKCKLYLVYISWVHCASSKLLGAGTVHKSTVNFFSPFLILVSPIVLLCIISIP